MGYVEGLEQFLELAPAGQGMVAGMADSMESVRMRTWGVTRAELEIVLGRMVDLPSIAAAISKHGGLEAFIESDTGHLFGVLHRNAWARYSDITVLLDRPGISSDLCEVVLRGFVRDSTKAVSLMRDELWRLDGVRAAKMEKA